MLLLVLCILGVRAEREWTRLVINRITALPVNTCIHASLTSFPLIIRLYDWVGQWNAADVEYLDFTRALNQIAYDILVDKMEEREMHLLE